MGEFLVRFLCVFLCLVAVWCLCVVLFFFPLAVRASLNLSAKERRLLHELGPADPSNSAIPTDPE